MDDLAWIDPKPNGAIGDCWHDACTEPRPGFILYARVDVLAAAERVQGSKRKSIEKPDGKQ